MVQIWPGHMRLVYTEISSGHIWTTLYIAIKPAFLWDGILFHTSRLFCRTEIIRVHTQCNENLQNVRDGCGPGSSVGIATGYRLDGPRIGIPVWARFSAPVQTGPGANPASCTMGTGTFPGGKSGRGVTLTPHHLLLPWSRKGRAIPLLPLWAVPLYSASVPVQGCTLPYLYQQALRVIPYPTAFPYGNGMVLHFYQQQESSTTKTVHKVINKGLKAYV